MAGENQTGRLPSTIARKGVAPTEVGEIANVDRDIGEIANVGGGMAEIAAGARGTDPTMSGDRAAAHVTAIQRRTVTTLVGSQVAGGIGTSSGIAVAALAAESIGSAGLSGLAQTASVLGSAIAAIPLSRLMAARGRRPGLATGYLIAAGGAMVCITAGNLGLFWLFIAGMFLVGWATSANLQARYAATDLATDRTRARSVAIIVWATTAGAVVGPNLIDPGAVLANRLGLPALFGPFVFALAAFGIAVAVVLLRLRPDPLLTARARSAMRETNDATHVDRAIARPGTLTALALIARHPGTLLAVLAMASAHAAMVAVMAMTPVHLTHDGAALSVVGFVISMHIAGMYSLSPLFGWLADVLGRVKVIVTGQLLVLLATAVTGLAPSGGAGQVGIGLTLLGLGWSCSLVAGSALLSESVSLDIRPSVQGVADLVMGLSAAAAAALAGLVISTWGYGILNAAAASILAVPLLAAVRYARQTVPLGTLTG
jgi:MFS family permease